MEHESDAMQGFLAGLQGPDVPAHDLLVGAGAERLAVHEPEDGGDVAEPFAQDLADAAGRAGEEEALHQRQR